MTRSAEWSSEMLQTARRMWADGNSAGEIAKQLKVSRGAVAGKMNRNRSLFPKRTSAETKKAGPAAASKTARSARQPKVKEKTREPKRAEAKPSPPPRRQAPVAVRPPAAAPRRLNRSFVNPEPFNSIGPGRCKMFQCMDLEVKATGESLVCAEPVHEPDAIGISSQYCLSCLLVVAPGLDRK